MGWAVLEPPPRAIPRTGVDATLSCVPAGKFLPPRMILSVRQQARPPFFTVGAYVDVLVGDGAETGLLRLRPGTGFRVSCWGPKGVTMLLVLPLLPGVQAGNRWSEACETRLDGDGLVVQLPARALEPADRVVTTPPPAKLASVPKATPVKALPAATTSNGAKPAAAPSKVPATRREIETWAAPRGLAPGGEINLAAINAKRRDLYLPPFELVRP